MKKNKNNGNNLVTKTYLDGKLGILNKKIDNLKEYVYDKFEKNTKDILKYVDIRFKAIDERFEKVDKKLEMLDSIMKTLDWLAKEYKDSKEERIVQAELYKRLDERMTTLEKRILTS